MINWICKLFKVEPHVKLVMVWDGRNVQHWRLTEKEYRKLLLMAWPMGFSVLSEMDI